MLLVAATAALLGCAAQRPTAPTARVVAPRAVSGLHGSTPASAPGPVAVGHAHPKGGPGPAPAPAPNHAAKTAEPDPSSKQAPASRYAALDRAGCFAELTRRKIPFTSAKPQKGVEIPIRLAGKVHGVAIRSLAARPGTQSVYDILDCRLALAVADFAELLAQHDVVEAIHFSFYRPGARIGKSGKPSQHSRGLAFDLGQLKLKNGSRISVEKDWQGEVGDDVECDASPPKEAAARLLMRVVCEAARRRIFHLILTPNYNKAHFNHFHLDLQPGRSYFDLR